MMCRGNMMDKKVYFMVVLLMGLLSAVVEAKTYRWVDANGKVHYSDSQPKSANVTSKEVYLPNTTSFPEVTIKKAIPYEDFTPPQKVTLKPLALKIAGANSRDIKIGNLYSGQTCQKKESDLVWVEGHRFVDDIQLSGVFVSEFNRLGYELEYENAMSSIRPDNRLVLKTELTTLKINRCIEKGTYRIKSKNDAYVKLSWTLLDQLSRKTLYEGSSEGLYKGLTELARENGTEQAIERAIVVAVNNALSDVELTEPLGKVSQIGQEAPDFKPIPLNLIYTADTGSFKSKVDALQQSTVTIRTTKGHGSGVLLSNNGHILTNAHVVGDAHQVIVILNGEELEAFVERIEPIRDVALLKLSKTMVTEQAPISATPPSVGDALFVIGTPLSEELSHTVTQGILSAKRDRGGLPFYQTDAAINHGNSGGPIYNDVGGLLAISVSGVMTKAGASLGLNYLIPIDDALRSLNISRQEKGAESRISPEKRSVSDEAEAPRQADDDAVFDLYQAGLVARQKGQFSLAKDNLSRAVALLPKTDDSAQANTMRDELYFALPVAQAKQAIADKQPNHAKKYLAPLNAYILNHPDRFALAKEIAEVKESAQYLDQALKQTAHISGQVDLLEVKMIMMEYHAENGRLPKTKTAVIALLNEQLGRRLFNRYELLEYEGNSTGFSMIFRNIERNKRVVLEAAV